MGISDGIPLPSRTGLTRVLAARTHLRRSWISLVRCAVLTAPCVAHSQTSLSVTTLGGYLWIDPLLKYGSHFAGYYADWRSNEVFSFSNAPIVGARIKVSRGSTWFGYFESVYASSRLKYRYETSVATVTPPGPPQVTKYLRWDVAKITTFELGAGRNFDGHALHFDWLAGAGVYHLQPTKSGGFCPVGVPCDNDRWESVYNVPTFATGVNVRTPAFHRLAIELDGKGSIGRINTKGFSDTPPRNSFLYEPPAHRWLHTASARLGFSFGRN